MKEDVAAILQKSPLGRGLTKEDIDEILKDKSTQIKTYEKGNTIFMEGERPSKIFLLIKGNVGVLKGTFSGKRISRSTKRRNCSSSRSLRKGRKIYPWQS